MPIFRLLLEFLAQINYNMKSKTTIDRQARRKTNPLLFETIIAAKKNTHWNELADLLSRPRRKRVEMNLSEIENEAKDGETIVVPGKVLSQGELDKKIKLVAFAFSQGAREKLAKKKIEMLTIEEEIKKNPSAKGIKILK